MSWQNQNECTAQVEWDEGDPMPEKWFAVPGSDRCDDCAWTISPCSSLPGWNTDGGYEGYGLPKAIALELVARLNAKAE